MTKTLASVGATMVAVVAVALVDVITPTMAVMTIVSAAVFFAGAHHPAWFATRRPAHVATVALVLEALVVLAGDYARDITPPIAVGFIVIHLALGLVIVAALTAVAWELRSRVAIAGALAWLVGWIGVGALELWALLARVLGHWGERPYSRVSSLMFALGGAVIGSSLVRSADGAERRSIARWYAVFVLVSAYTLVDRVHVHHIGAAVAWFALAAMLRRWHLPPSPVPRAIISTADSR